MGACQDGAWRQMGRALVVCTCLLLFAATQARALVVSDPSGRRLGIALRTGVSARSLGRLAPLARPPAPLSTFSANGNLNYNGGPVLHSSAPYLIFWDPASQIS